MILLRTSYRPGASSNIILNCNLMHLGVYMAKLCHEKNAIFKMYPPQKTEHPPEKKLTFHPLKNLEHPDKKLYSMGIILIP